MLGAAKNLMILKKSVVRGVTQVDAVQSATTVNSVVTIPASVQAGDFLLLHAACEGTSTLTFTTPTGWTLTSLGAHTTGNFAEVFFYKTAVASDAGNTVTVTSKVTIHNSVAWAGVTLLALVGGNFDKQASASSTAFASVTPSKAGSAIIYMGAGYQSGSAIAAANYPRSPPIGMLRATVADAANPATYGLAIDYLLNQPSVASVPVPVPLASGETFLGYTVSVTF